LNDHIAARDHVLERRRRLVRAGLDPFDASQAQSFS
jgi:hypothetical protein